MPVIVVSHVPGLAAALASRLDARGIDPEDVPTYLESADEVAGAIVDGAADAPTIEVATAIRRHDPWCPLILLLAGDELPAPETTDSLQPVRLVRRPFTTATVVDHMVSMQRSGPPRPTKPSPVAEVDDDKSLGEAPTTAEPSPTGSARSRWGRRRTDDHVGGESLPRLAQAVEVLLRADLPPTVADAAERAALAAAQLVSAETAIAVLVRHEDAWHVEAGRGLRANEARALIAPTHWLARHVQGRDTAVVVSGTDVARQELTGLPLIHLEYWMAVTMHQSAVMVIVGRSAEPPFEVSDAVTLSEALTAIVTDIEAAHSVRRLAQRLEKYL